MLGMAILVLGVLALALISSGRLDNPGFKNNRDIRLEEIRREKRLAQAKFVNEEMYEAR